MCRECPQKKRSTPKMQIDSRFQYVEKPTAIGTTVYAAAATAPAIDSEPIPPVPGPSSPSKR